MRGSVAANGRGGARTDFTPTQLLDPDTQASEKILRACVHCGFCTATCPTYVLLGDELDSPRGRIYLIKNMLEAGGLVAPEVVTHIDRCLSCLACMTTCPSGVHYMHLARPRPPACRAALSPPAGRAVAAPDAGRGARPAGLVPHGVMGRRRRRFLAALLPQRLRDARPRPDAAAKTLAGRPAADLPRDGERRRRAADRLRAAGGHAADQRSNDPAAYPTWLRRWWLPRGACGQEPSHHLGQEEPALAFAKANIDRLGTGARTGGLDAIVVTASGCGTTIKDYGFMLREDPAYAGKAARVSKAIRDPRSRPRSA